MIARTVKSPERTCLGCRKRDTQTALVRLAADGDRVVIDEARRKFDRKLEAVGSRLTIIDRVEVSTPVGIDGE